VSLAFAHPVSEKPIRCAAPLPEDMQALLQVLANDQKKS
jgi:hypothetical protein